MTLPNSRQPLQSTAAASAPLVSLRRGKRQLFETERRLNAVLNNASVSIFLMDDQQHCIYMNRAAEQLTGWTLQEVLARNCPLHDIVHHTYPDGRPFPLEECAIDRAFPENNQERGEEVFVHRDGRFFPVGFTASPIRDDEANIIGTIIEVRDISEEKAAAKPPFSASIPSSSQASQASAAQRLMMASRTGSVGRHPSARTGISRVVCAMANPFAAGRVRPAVSADRAAG